MVLMLWNRNFKNYRTSIQALRKPVFYINGRKLIPICKTYTVAVFHVNFNAFTVHSTFLNSPILVSFNLNLISLLPVCYL
jgi:hypothetical protein